MKALEFIFLLILLFFSCHAYVFRPTGPIRSYGPIRPIGKVVNLETIRSLASINTWNRKLRFPICSVTIQQSVTISPSQIIHNNINLSTIVKPKKTDKTKKDIKIEPPAPEIFKEARNFEQEFLDELDKDKYMVILYNDPFNKRQYVSQTLMEVFSWSQQEAENTMMQAHTYGFAITGEWYKELAEDYCTKLVQKGLVAEVKQSGGSGDADGE